MATTNNTPKPHVDEDVDDLDDVLDEFNALPPPAPSASKSPVPTKTPPGASASASTSTQSQPPPPGPSEEDFAAEFARQMESVLLGLGGTAAAPAPAAGKGQEDKADEAKREAAFRAAWEAMLVEEMDGLVDPEGAAGKDAGKQGEAKKKAGAGSKDAGKAGAGAEDAFQRSVRQAMERLKTSEETLQADAAAGPEDELEKLLAQLGEGGDDDDALHGILEGMMGQLMGKEVLYEPLKELHDKFPEYLVNNAATLDAEDTTRYKAQQTSVARIIAIFEDPAYSDADATKSAEIVTLMSEMQAHGTPPAEIMGPMPPGLDLGPDGLPKMPEGCTIA